MLPPSEPTLVLQPQSWKLLFKDEHAACLFTQPPPSPSWARPTSPFPHSCLHEAPAPRLLVSLRAELSQGHFSPLRGCQTCFWMYPSSKHFDMKSYSFVYVCVWMHVTVLLSPWGSPHLVEGTFTHGYLARRTTFCHFEMTGLWRPFPGR